MMAVKYIPRYTVPSQTALPSNRVRHGLASLLEVLVLRCVPLAVMPPDLSPSPLTGTGDTEKVHRLTVFYEQL